MFLKHLNHNPGEEEEFDDDMTNVNIAKAVAMTCLFIASFSLGTLPIKLNKWLKWETDAKNNYYVKLLLSFGGGVLFCTTFMHMLPEVAEGVENLEIEPFENYELHLAQLLMCTGFFAMYFVEELVHAWIHKREGLSAVRKSLSVRRGDLDDGKKHSHNHNHSHIHNNNHDHVHQDHSHVVLIEADSTVKTVRGLLIVLALSIHELFEGLAVGLEGSSVAVWYMFGAVSAHKFVIAFCIGVELVTLKMRTLLIIIYVFTFAVVSPIGIGVGIAVTNTEGDYTEQASVFLQGLASGTLLYVVFFEILQADRKTGIKQFFAVFIGFLFMVLITIFC